MIGKLKIFLFIAILLLIGIGFFVLGNFLVRILEKSGQEFIEDRTFSPTIEKQTTNKSISMERLKGPRLWTKLTKGWVSGTAVSRKKDFPGYNDPIPRSGYIINNRKRSNVTVGTALAISPNGVWLTAKHVVENCKTIVVQAGLKSGRLANLLPNKVFFHEKADVALITVPKTDFRRRPFYLAGKSEIHSAAFHIGFPRGKPGAVQSRLIGRMKAKRGRRHKFREELLVWAEITRIPNFSGPLGGLSGGATIDNTGALIGITSAASVRRGRILTSLISTISEIIDKSGFAVRQAPYRRPIISELTSKKYPIFAGETIQGRRVVRVICRR